MKKLFIILSILITSFTVGYGQVFINSSGGIQPAGSTFAGYYGKYLQGATKIVNDTTARDTIPSYYRDTTTFMCYTIADSSFWILQGGINNSNFVRILPKGSGSGGISDSTYFFKNGGNSFGSTSYIGNNDSFPLYIKSYATPSIRINPHGLTTVGGTGDNVTISGVGGLSATRSDISYGLFDTYLQIPYDTLHGGTSAIATKGDSLYFKPLSSGVNGKWVYVGGSGGVVNDSTYFKNGGNSFGKTAILGTNDPYDLSIRREGLQYMFLNGGNVFFGTKQGDLSTNSSIDTFGNSVLRTVSSLYSLQIPKDTNRNTLSDPNYSRISGEANTGHLYFQNYNGGNWNKIAFTTDITSGNVTGTGVAQRIPYWNSSNNISYTNNLVYDTALIRLGIGTSTPSSALDIHSSTNNMADLNNSSYTGSSFLLFQKVDTTKWKIGNNYNSGANTFEVQNITKLNTPLSIDTNSKVNFLNSPYVGSNKIIDASDSSIAGGYYPYSSNPRNYITLNSLSATKNSNTSIFSYNSTTGAYNLDTTKIGVGTITGVTAGIDLTGGGTSGSVTLNADTTTGSTKLATQGFVTRNSGSVSLSSNNTWTGVQTFNSSVTASGGSGIGTNITDTLKAAANNDVTIGLNIAPTFTNSSYTGVKNYSIKAIGDIVSGNTSSAASLYLGRTNFAPSSASTQLYRDFGTGNFFINTDALSTSGGGGIFLQTSGTTRLSVDNASTMNLGTASYYGMAVIKNGLANTVQYLYGGGGENYTLYRNSSGYQVAIGGDAVGAATFYAKGTNANLSATDIKMKIYPSGGLVLQNGGTFTDDATNIVQVNGSVKATQYRLSALNTAPASASDTGTLGEIRITSGYIYICTATNTWVRAALSTWP